MPYLMRWQPGDISLVPRVPETETQQAVALNKESFSFNLSPLTLVSEEDRFRLLTALVNLRQKSGAEEPLVDLQIPTVWGVTLRLPDPGLNPANLVQHLQWELSKAILDSTDNYRFTYAQAEEETILVAALRTLIYDQINRVLEESGYKLQSLFLDEDLFSKLNLAESLTPTPPPLDLEDKATVTPRFEKRRLAREKRTVGNQPSWFFPILITLATVLLVLFIWMKVTSDKKPPRRLTALKETLETGSETETLLDSRPRTVPDSAALTQLPTDTVASGGLSDTLASAPAPLKYTRTGMSPRLELIQQVLADPSLDGKFSLISFTADRFLCQFEASNPEALDNVMHGVQTLPRLSGVKLKKVPAAQGFQGTITGRIALDSLRQEFNPPDSSRVISLARSRGLLHKALVFTGSAPATLGFLNDLAAEQMAIYRLILLPWNAQEYRTVIDF